MNTIDNVPNREQSEQVAESDNRDNRTPADQDNQSDFPASVSGTDRYIFEDADVAAAVRNEREKPNPTGGNEKDPTPGVKTQTLSQHSADDRANELEKGDSKNEQTKDSTDKRQVVPQSLAKRYLIAENKFYFRDDPDLMAFEDKGKRLSTEHNDPQVAQSMVELAQAKSWSSIKVKGTLEFKREVWLAGSLRGLDVQGYQPRAVDKARLAELRSERPVPRQNTIEQGTHREPQAARAETTQKTREDRAPGPDKSRATDDPYSNLTKQQRTAVDTFRAILTQRGDSPQAVAMATNLALERFGQQRVYVGRLLRHGAARYEHKPDEKMNYFVTLQAPSGEQTVWGVDLERALAAAKATPGDDLALVHKGKTRVIVPVNERDEDGKLTGKQVEMVVGRNWWEIGKLDKMREEAQARVRAAAEHTARNQPEVRVYDVPAHQHKQATEPGKARGREQAPSR